MSSPEPKRLRPPQRASRDNRSLPARSDPTAEVAAGPGPAEPGSAAGPHTARARAVSWRRSARAVRPGGAVEHGGALARSGVAARQVDTRAKLLRPQVAGSQTPWVLGDSALSV